MAVVLIVSADGQLLGPVPGELEAGGYAVQRVPSAQAALSIAPAVTKMLWASRFLKSAFVQPLAAMACAMLGLRISRGWRLGH